MMLRHISTQLLRRPQCSAVWSTHHCLYSDDSKSNDGDRKNTAEGFDMPKAMASVKEMENQEAQQFLDNMDELMKRRKKRIEDSIEQMRDIHYVPKTITAHNWMIMLTEHESDSRRKKYLEYLAKSEFKKENDKRFKPRPEKKTSHRVLNELTYPVSKRNKLFPAYNGYSAMMFGSPFIFDCDFEMPHREQLNVERQLLHCYNQNINHCQPCHLYLTGYKNTRMGKMIECLKLDEKWFATFHEGSFLDLFRPEELIYLSPDGPPLKAHDVKDKIPVIGASVDLNPRPRMTLGKAKSLGIKAGRIPMDQHIRLLSARSLTLTSVLGIMLSMNLMHNWRDAIAEGLPKRRFEILSDYQKDKRMKKSFTKFAQTGKFGK